MHRLSKVDLLSILASARAEFPRLWLYFAPNQGVLVACAWDCRPGDASLQRMKSSPALAPDLEFTGGPAKLLEERVLGPDDIDRLLAGAKEAGLDESQLVSTDDNLLLEYSTPRANVRGYAPSLRENLAFLRAAKNESFR
jgi:hypothetical protein